MMRLRRSILLLTLLAAFLPVRAQVLWSYRDSVPDGYNFLLYLPAGADTCSTPLPTVLFLHGKSLCGDDLNDVLRRNDSYHALAAIGGLIVTGATGTNVNDLCIALLDR